MDKSNYFSVSSQAVSRYSLYFGTAVAAHSSCSQKSSSACVTWKQRRRNKPKHFITLPRVCFYNITETDLQRTLDKKHCVCKYTSALSSGFQVGSLLHFHLDTKRWLSKQHMLWVKYWSDMCDSTAPTWCEWTAFTQICFLWP